MPEPDRPSYLTTKTWVPLGGAVVVLLATMAWLDNRFEKAPSRESVAAIQKQMDGMGETLDEVRKSQADLQAAQQSMVHQVERINDRASDRWTATMMKVWELELRQRNPTMDFPDVWEIVRGASPAPR